MIIAHSTIDAASRAPVRGRSAAGAVVCACALLVCALPAVAADGPRGGERQAAPDHRGARQNDGERDAQRPDPRQAEPNPDAQRRLLRQEQQAARTADARRSGKLTPDERRDLRRQINEAGIDLYPNTPRR